MQRLSTLVNLLKDFAFEETWKELMQRVNNTALNDLNVQHALLNDMQKVRIVVVGSVCDF